jgi:hypothetical protein
MDLIELLLDPHHVGVQSGASKLIYEPMVRLAQTVHLSCIEINIISKPSGAPKMIFKPIAHSAQTVHLFCLEISTISK